MFTWWKSGSSRWNESSQSSLWSVVSDECSATSCKCSVVLSGGPGISAALEHSAKAGLESSWIAVTEDVSEQVAAASEFLS